MTDSTHTISTFGFKTPADAADVVRARVKSVKHFAIYKDSDDRTFRHNYDDYELLAELGMVKVGVRAPAAPHVMIDTSHPILTPKEARDLRDWLTVVLEALGEDGQ